jgi:hypothetical protein
MRSSVVLDQNGKFLDEWKQFGSPSGQCIDKDGKVVAFVPGHVEGGPEGAAGEGVVVGPDGNLYAAENTLRGVTKYARKQ